MNICELYSSIQGEGEFAGYPALFIRLGGCTRECTFCDTKYHSTFEQMTPKEVMKKIFISKQNIVIWTGGEPILQIRDMMEVIKVTTPIKSHHLETNGDLLNYDPHMFSYIAFSPKDPKRIPFIKKFVKENNFLNYDIKVVTDLSINQSMLKDATRIMPLTTHNRKLNQKINQRVWEYCIKNRKIFCLRQHYQIFGKRRKI